MATAEAKQRKQEEASRPPEPGPADGVVRRSRRGGTRQLDFFQAMTDFRQMFPTLDDEVIEAVLRANDGAVDATIDQLLTMTIDEDITSKMSEAELLACCPQYDEQDQGAAAAEDSPPSYLEAIRAQAQAHAEPSPSIWTTPIDRAQTSTTSPETPEPVPIMTRPPDDVHEGYGDDTDKTLDAFPFSQELPKGKDGDAELRRQLSGMGKDGML